MPVNDMLKEILYMNWLRPEVVVWDTVASELIGKELKKLDKIMEVGIGNGYFTFMSLGGKFKPEYDWYYNVDIDAHTKNEDMYNALSITNIKKYVESYPASPIQVAVDHKDNLLAQARQLDLAKDYILGDANDIKIFPEGRFYNIYTNMIYWLNNPIKMIENFGRLLNPGGKIVLVFPNAKFYQYCTSYNRSSKWEKLLNAGRADSIKWHMNLSEFERELKRKTDLKIIKHKRYLSKKTLEIWDFGLRPLSPHLINMANSLSGSKRLEIKHEWCETALKYLLELYQHEKNDGDKEGGFNFVVLEKN